MSPRKSSDKPFLERFGGLTTWVLVTIGGGLLNTGIMYQQFQTVKQNQEESKADLKSTANRLAEFREKQIQGLGDIQVLKSTVQGLDSRVLVIERIFIEKPRESIRK